MTQASRPVAGRLTDYPNSDCGPYSGPQWRELFHNLFTLDRTTQGPLSSVDEELEVEVVNALDDDIRVNTGAGFCNGALLLNDADVEFSSAPSGTVVMVLNATNAAYNTNLTFPDDTTDYGVGPSVEAYTCRICIFTGAGSIVQNDSIWMVPLAEYGGGSSLTDEREFCEYAGLSANRTRQILVPHNGMFWFTPNTTYGNNDSYVGGYTVRTGAMLRNTADLVRLYAGWVVPEDFVSDLSATLIFHSNGVHTYRLAAYAYYGQVGETASTHGHSWGWSNWADGGPANMFVEVHTFNLTDAQIGDIVTFQVDRDCDHASDGTGNPNSPGWMIEYTSDS